MTASAVGTNPQTSLWSAKPSLTWPAELAVPTHHGTPPTLQRSAQWLRDRTRSCLRKMGRGDIQPPGAGKGPRGHRGGLRGLGASEKKNKICGRPKGVKREKPTRVRVFPGNLRCHPECAGQMGGPQGTFTHRPKVSLLPLFQNHSLTPKVK